MSFFLFGNHLVDKERADCFFDHVLAFMCDSSFVCVEL